MTKVHAVKHAQKDYPQYEIKKGEPYYWWQFAFGPKRFSKTQPTRSQLTQSSFLKSLYDLQDRIGKLSAETTEELDAFLEEIRGDIEGMKDEVEGSLENMPEHLRESSSSGQLLQERMEGLESWISDLDQITIDYEEDTTLSDEENKDALQEYIDTTIEEIQNADPGL